MTKRYLTNNIRSGGLALMTAGLISASALAVHASELKVAVTSLSTHLDPMGFNAIVNMRVSQNALETLLRYDPETGEFRSGLATEWKMLNPTVMSLTLRDGVTCHNGEDFTAEDVAVMFGPTRFQGEDAPGFNTAKQFLDVIKDVRATGPLTVEIETREPDPLLKTRLASWMSEVPCADAYQSAGSWEAWGQAVVGTGPYKVAEVRPGELQRFERFDGYWGEAAPVDAYTLQVVPEVAARVAGLLTGEFDIITEIFPDQFKVIADNPGAEVVGGSIRNVRLITYDTRNKVLSDPRIRRALNLAIDRQLIVDTIFDGRVLVPNGFQLPSFGQMYISDFAGTGFDPDKARELLAEAGYQGEEIPFQYLTDYYTGEVVTTQILQQMWKDVGLNVKIELKENWDQILNEEFDAQRGIINESSNAVYPDPIGQIYRQFGPNGFYQVKGYWANQAFNEASKGLYAIEPEARRAAFQKMLDIFEQDAPGTYLNVLPLFYGKRTDVNWTPIDTPFMDFRSGNLDVAANR